MAPSYCLTVDFGASTPKPTLFRLPALEQSVVNIPGKLVEFGVGRIHDVDTSFAQDPANDPPLR